MNRRIGSIAVAALLIVSFSFTAGCKSRKTIKEESNQPQTEQNSSSTTEVKQEENKDPQKTGMEDWKYDVPKGYELEENGGPWYEKRYSNENGVVLLFGCYALNGTDNRTDKQILEDTADNEKEDLASRYGIGEITYTDADSDNMIVTTYYETRDLKVLKRSKIEGQVSKTLYIEIPVFESQEDYEHILDIVK